MQVFRHQVILCKSMRAKQFWQNFSQIMSFQIYICIYQYIPGEKYSINCLHFGRHWPCLDAQYLKRVSFHGAATNKVRYSKNKLGSPNSRKDEAWINDDSHKLKNSPWI